MPAPKLGRSVLDVVGPLLKICVLIPSTLPALHGLAAAADPPAAITPAQEETKAELHRLAQEARRLEQARKLPEAIAACEETILLARGLYGDASEAVCRLQDWLARLHEGSEDWRPAREARQAVLATCAKLYGEKDWRVTNARLALEQTIQLSQLEPVQRNELAKATTLNQQVVRLYETGQFRRAVELAEDALAIRKKILGEAHADYAASLNNLAQLWQTQREYATAEPL